MAKKPQKSDISADAIVLTASFKGARTTVDGGLDVTFSVIPDDAEYLKQLMALHGTQLRVVVMVANETGIT